MEAEGREVEGWMGLSVVGSLVDCFAGGVCVTSEVVGLATRAEGLNTLPDRMTSAHISVA